MSYFWEVKAAAGRLKATGCRLQGTGGEGFRDSGVKGGFQSAAFLHDLTP
jgi:hypothetical protein